MARHQSTAPLQVASGPVLTQDAPARTWDELITQLDQHLSDTALPRLARERQAAGQPVEVFADSLIEAIEARERCDRMGQVFKLANEGGWNMDQASIEFAADRIKAGDDAITAYAAAAARAGSKASATQDDQLRAWTAACLAYDAADAAFRAAQDAHEAADDHVGVSHPDELKYWKLDPETGRRHRIALYSPGEIQRRYPATRGPEVAAKQADLLARLEVWRAECAAQKAAYRLDELQEAKEAALEPLRKAREAVLSMQPPTIQGLIFQMQVASGGVVGNGLLTIAPDCAGDALQDPNGPEAIYLRLFGYLRHLAGQGAAHSAFMAVAEAERETMSRTAAAFDLIEEQVEQSGVDDDGFCAGVILQELRSEGVSVRVFDPRSAILSWPAKMTSRLKAIAADFRADPSKLAAVKWAAWSDRESNMVADRKEVA